MYCFLLPSWSVLLLVHKPWSLDVKPTLANSGINYPWAGDSRGEMFMKFAGRSANWPRHVMNLEAQRSVSEERIPPSPYIYQGQGLLWNLYEATCLVPSGSSLIKRAFYSWENVGFPCFLCEGLDYFTPGKYEGLIVNYLSYVTSSSSPNFLPRAQEFEVSVSFWAGEEWFM